MYGQLHAAPPAPSSQPAEDPNLLARRIGSGYVVRTSEHFVVIHSAKDAAAPDPNAMLEPAYRQFCESFKKAGFALAAPPTRMVWVCFPSHTTFNAYASDVDHMDMSWLDSYYSARTNRVAVAPLPKAADTCPTGIKGPAGADWTRAIHEAAHQMAFNTGLQRRGVMYPVWASEGLATNFEPSPGAPMGLGGDNTVRRSLLVEMLSADRMTPLSELVVLTRVTAGETGAAKELYAQAWGLFRFLLTERPAQLRQYLSTLADLPPGRRDESTLMLEFTDAFGPLPKLEDSYAKYLRSLAPAK